MWIPVLAGRLLTCIILVYIHRLAHLLAWCHVMLAGTHNNYNLTAEILAQTAGGVKQFTSTCAASVKI